MWIWYPGKPQMYCRSVWCEVFAADVWITRACEITGVNTSEYVFHTSVYVFYTSEYVFFEYVFYTGVSLCGIDCGEGNTVLCTPERRSREGVYWVRYCPKPHSITHLFHVTAWLASTCTCTQKWMKIEKKSFYMYINVHDRVQRSNVVVFSVV